VRRRSLLILAATLALLALPVLAAPVGAASRIDAASARAYAYWTADRIASAKVRDLTPAGVPIPKVGKPGSGSGVTGASWTGGGDVVKLTGKVYFSMGGGNWQCSGSVIADSRSTYTTVLTAGHCAIDETTGEFATNWVFIPSWDTKPATFSTACNSGATTYGCWAALGLYVHWGFANAGSFNNQAVTHDWAFAVVGTGSNGGQLDTTVGAGYSLGYNVITTQTRVQPFGYPAAGKYHGNDLSWCAGNPAYDVKERNDATKATWGVACDMTGGSSGGPWFSGLTESGANAGNGGTVVSLNSYGYSGVKNMYGPNFNTQTSGTLNSAQTDTTPSNTVFGTAP
jgi:hypothetical protein